MSRKTSVLSKTEHLSAWQRTACSVAEPASLTEGSTYESAKGQTTDTFHGSGLPSFHCYYYYLYQVHKVNGGDTVFIRCVCVCVCVSVHSVPVNQTSLKRLNLRTSNLTNMFPGTVWRWPLKNYYSAKIHLAEICTLTSTFWLLLLSLTCASGRQWIRRRRQWAMRGSR